jgi:hypothetical protein
MDTNDPVTTVPYKNEGEPGDIVSDIHVYKPKERGKSFTFDNITNGKKKLFQMPTNENKKIVANAGIINGMPTLQNIVPSRAPSIRPASINSFGTALAA